MKQAKQNFKLQLFVTILGVVLFVIKITAYYFTNSLSILTDALESIVNMLAGFIGLYSLYVASKPKDSDHPYGHGKAEFISAAVEGTLIIAAGFFIVYQSVESFFQSKKMVQIDTGLWLIASTAFLNYVAGSYCIFIGKKNNSLALKASGKHLQVDTYSTIAIIIGLLLIRITGLFWFDKILALVIALLVIYNGYKILRSSLAGIMDEADIQLLNQLIIILNENRKENWVDLHNLRVIKYGSLLHVDCHLTVPWYLNVQQAHNEVDSLTALIKNNFGDSIEFFVHTDACVIFSCEICIKHNCSQRKKTLQQQLQWTLENVLFDSKHQLPI